MYVCMFKCTIQPINVILEVYVYKYVYIIIVNPTQQPWKKGNKSKGYMTKYEKKIQKYYDVVRTSWKNWRGVDKDKAAFYFRFRK